MDCSVIGPGLPSVPALLTATSSRPNRSTVRSTRRRTSSSSRTSARINSASPPTPRSSDASAAPSSSRRPEMTMRAPSCAKARAVARPMPVRAPVIRTTGVFIMVLSSQQVNRHLLPLRITWAAIGLSTKTLYDRAILFKHRSLMELRHLRYFVAVAEEGSLTHAAERRLHTAQPSLSRQIRDLELEVGVELFVRSSRGIELTEAGRVFLDYVRLALLQVDAAGDAARRAAHPAKASFVLGFLTGHEVTWLPDALRILRDELPNIEVTISSQSSPELAGALLRGTVDVAFLRREDRAPGLAFKFLIKEPLVAVLPSDHRLAARKAIRPRDIVGETFIRPTKAAPALKVVIAAYAARSGISLASDYEAENLAMAISLVASTRGISLLPLYARNLLPPSVVSRPLQGEAPTIDLVLGYSKANTSPLLKRFLTKVDELVALVAPKIGQ